MIVTTSRYASLAVREAAAELARQNKAIYVARGKRTIRELVDFAWKRGHFSVLIVREKKSKVAAVGEIAIDHWGNWSWKL